MATELTFAEGLLFGAAGLVLAVGLAALTGSFVRDLISKAMAKEVERWNHIRLGGAVRDVAREEARKEIKRAIENSSNSGDTNGE